MSTFLPLTVKWPWVTSWRAMSRLLAKPGQVHNVVQAALKELEHVVAGPAVLAGGFFVVVVELALQHAVDATGLFCFSRIWRRYSLSLGRFLPCSPGG